MKDPALGYFIFHRAGLKYILMHEMPAEHPQGPPTEGPWPATSGALQVSINCWRWLECQFATDR